MKTILLFSIHFLFLSFAVYADNPAVKLGHKLKAESIDISVFNNQYYFPFLGMKNLINAKYHPGIAFGYSRNLKEKKSRVLYSDVKLGLYHHRFIQTGIQLYGNIGYRFNLTHKFYISTEYGLGYLHSIKHQTTFKADAEGNYSKISNFGRAQLMTGIGLGFGKQLTLASKPMRLYIKYQPWFQLPFIKSYVPLLPNNSMHLGINLILK
jgi:hypothetical protein